MAFVPLEELSPPDAERLYSGRPVLAADASRFASGFNHLAGVRLRRATRTFVDCDASAVIPIVNITLPAPAVAASHVISVLHRCSAKARHLWLGIEALCQDESTTTARIDAALKSASGGTTHDIGVRFDRDEGTFPSANVGLDLGVGSISFAQTAMLTTGSRTQDAAAGGGTPTRPRLLYVPSGAYDTRCQVELTCRECRVVAVTVAEWVEDEV